MRQLTVRMPKFSMAQEEGLLLAWHKGPGDPVTAGELLCEVATDKVDMEVESPVTGRITELLAAPNASVPVGEPIALVESEADDLLEGLLDGSPAPTSAAPVDAPTTRPEAATAPSRKGTKPAMPGARRRAAELGVMLAEVAGSGSGGVVTLADVERAAAGSQRAPDQSPSPAAVPAPVPAQPSSTATPIDPRYSDALADRRRSIRAAVARRMSESAAIPQFTVFADLDLETLSTQRDGIGWTTWLVRALAMTAREHPEVNASWTQDGAQSPPCVGVSLAVDTPVGLLAPVVTDADLVDPRVLDTQIRRLVDRARGGKLTAADLDGGTITLSNLGGFGVHSFQALLTPPQVAALSVGAIERQAVVRGGGLVARLLCRVGLTVDHRAADGADAARFLADLQHLVAEPRRLAATAASGVAS